MRCDFSGWGDSLAVVAPQKCLGGPAGLSLLHVSDGAWARMEANPNAPRSSVLSILDWRDAHLPGKPFPFTPSVSDIYGLRACLREYLAEGPEAVRQRHQAAARATRAGFTGLGLTLWAPDPAARSDTVTTVKLPDGTDEREVRKVALAQSGVLLSGGHGDLSGKLLRIGHMGPSAFPLSAVVAVTAVGRALRSLGAKADIGAATEAATASLDS
jgi:pyridoxamine---pyruvate transaminase